MPWKHWFEDFLKHTQHLRRKRRERNSSYTLAAKCFCFTKEPHTGRLPIDVATCTTRPYPQQLTCTRADLGLQNNGRIVLSPEVRQRMGRQIFGSQELIEFVTHFCG